MNMDLALSNQPERSVGHTNFTMFAAIGMMVIIAPIAPDQLLAAMRTNGISMGTQLNVLPPDVARSHKP